MGRTVLSTVVQAVRDRVLSQQRLDLARQILKRAAS